MISQMTTFAVFALIVFPDIAAGKPTAALSECSPELDDAGCADDGVAMLQKALLVDHRSKDAKANGTVGNAAAVLVKAGAECSSSDTLMGGWREKMFGFGSLNDCMQAVVQAEGKFFSYGTGGGKSGWCKLERTPSVDCYEGFEADDYNFYRVDDGTPVPELNDPLEVAMAKIVYSIYSDTSPAGNWTLARHMVTNSDHIGVYESGGQCALVFSGTNDGEDIKNDLVLEQVDFCGLTDVHGGVVNEINSIVSAPEWTSVIKPYVMSNCGASVIATGHSLGGMIASVLAACANNNGTIQGPGGSQATLGFTVKSLYTYGAAAVSKDPLPNQLSEDGCFAGKRFFNLDSWTFDPVPALALAAPGTHRHPMVAAVQMHSDGDEVLSKTETECSKAALLPTLDDVGARGPSIYDHQSGKYVLRTMALYR